MSAAVYYVYVYRIAGFQAFSTSYVRNSNERNVCMLKNCYRAVLSDGPHRESTEVRESALYESKVHT